jgi:hypothetical protein
LHFIDLLTFNSGVELTYVIHQYKIMKLIFLILTSSLLVGCGGYKVTYNTVPQGASLICNNQHRGYTPYKGNYDLKSESKDQGYLKTEPCYAQWSSGARKDFSQYIDLVSWPDGVMVTAHRPDGGDYSQDANFALDVQRMKQQKQAQETQAWNSLNQSIQLQTQNIQLRNTLRSLRY